MTEPSSTEAAVRRLTAAVLGTDNAAVVDAAMAQGRAFDRYHPNQVASIAFPDGDRSSKVDLHAVHLRHGIAVQLRLDEQGRGTVRLVHTFLFCRPGFVASEAKGGDDMPRMGELSWTKTKRSPAELRALASRVLGPLPAEQLTSLLPPAPAGSSRASVSAQASRVFAAWLAGLPLPQPQPPPAAAVTASAIPKPVMLNGRVSGLWPSRLWGLWSSWPRDPAPASQAAAPHATAAAASVNDPRVGSDSGGDLVGAWAGFERLVLERIEGEGCSEAERAWFREI
ncbi:hypothetical protein GPECTOR_29g33 [Gonium pectorale]|uniref:Uncharacterized protein n=1 Tax=Gonium pectorale TaxID=33097 RepID=A0A150GEK0_GONPE|nr:hypothetical protein GPECTOR_29g33 [Gonium pectorale]|eukprot:KXZ48254.1 hypothetical protein GPECTOR_29g33 [Gonium pectorale]